MTFYGPRDTDDIVRVYELLTEIAHLYTKVDLPSFFDDNMIALSRNMAFTADPRFAAAFKENAADRMDQAKAWRLHTYCWAGHSALKVPGDFVECGVFEGLYSSTLAQYLDFGSVDKRMYLYDSFTGLSDEYSSESERQVVGGGYEGIENWYEGVVQRFAAYPNVEVIRGIIPDMLLEKAPQRIALLHLDLNAAMAEIGALEVLFGRVSDGGVILLDDFGRFESRELQLAHTTWMTSHGHSILELPTGQGLVIKRR